MFMNLVVLWICHQLNAPFWCYVLIWICMAMQMLQYGIELLNEKKRRQLSKCSKHERYERYKMPE